MFNLLVKNFLFTGLDINEITLLFKKINYKIMTFKKNEYIRFRGDVHEEIHIILKGSVKTEMLKPTGDTYIIESITAPSTLAPAFLFDTNNTFPVNVIADNNPTLLLISKTDFLFLLQNNKKILENYLKLISDKTFFLSQKIWFNFYNKTIKQKLSAYILENNQDNRFILNTSIENLSEFFGVARPSLSRCIKELIDKDILKRISKKEFLIKNIDFLLETLK